MDIEYSFSNESKANNSSLSKIIVNYILEFRN